MNYSMLSLCGQVLNVFANPKGVNKSTGEEYGGGHKVQLLANITLNNGETKMDIVTISTDTPAVYEANKGNVVRIPVKAFSMEKGQVGFYALKGNAPEVLTA